MGNQHSTPSTPPAPERVSIWNRRSAFQLLKLNHSRAAGKHCQSPLEPLSLAHFQDLNDRVDSLGHENAELRMRITVLVIQILLEHHRMSDRLREENAELLAKHERLSERIGTQLRSVKVEIEAALRCVDDFTGGDGSSETPRSIMDQRF